MMCSHFQDVFKGLQVAFLNAAVKENQALLSKREGRDVDVLYAESDFFKKRAFFWGGGFRAGYCGFACEERYDCKTMPVKLHELGGENHESIGLIKKIFSKIEHCSHIGRLVSDGMPIILAAIEENRYYLNEKNNGNDVGWEYAENDFMENFEDWAAGFKATYCSFACPEGSDCSHQRYNVHVEKEKFTSRVEVVV